MKELVKGDLADIGLGYEAKLEEGKIKISAVLDLTKLVDKGAVAVPGDSAIELLIVQLLKQAVLSL